MYFQFSQISGIWLLPDIRSDIRYLAFRIAGYPVNSISGTSLAEMDLILVGSVIVVPVPVIVVEAAETKNSC